jgi:hypothetical protein
MMPSKLFGNIMTKELLSRFFAAIVLAFLLGLLAHRLDADKLTRLQTQTSQACVDHDKQLADHGYGHDVVLIAFTGIFYMFLLETVAYVLRRGWRDTSPVSARRVLEV